MPRQPDIQYVQFYVDGTAARKLETNRKLQTQMPDPHKRRVTRRRKKVIAIDPLSVSAVLVAGVMLVSMAVGMMRLGTIDRETEKMEAYVVALQQENTTLRQTYQDGYDLEDIREKAVAMGLVPIVHNDRITIQAQVPVQQEEVTVWDQIGTFLAGLFA